MSWGVPRSLPRSACGGNPLNKSRSHIHNGPALTAEHAKILRELPCIQRPVRSAWRDIAFPIEHHGERAFFICHGIRAPAYKSLRAPCNRTVDGQFWDETAPVGGNFRQRPCAQGRVRQFFGIRPGRILIARDQS